MILIYVVVTGKFSPAFDFDEPCKGMERETLLVFHHIVPLVYLLFSCFKQT